MGEPPPADSEGEGCGDAGDGDGEPDSGDAEADSGDGEPDSGDGDPDCGGAEPVVGTGGGGDWGVEAWKSRIAINTASAASSSMINQDARIDSTPPRSWRPGQGNGHSRTVPGMIRSTQWSLNAGPAGCPCRGSQERSTSARIRSASKTARWVPSNASATHGAGSAAPSGASTGARYRTASRPASWSRPPLATTVSMSILLTVPARRSRAIGSLAAPWESSSTMTGVLVSSWATYATPEGLAATRASSQNAFTFGGSMPSNGDRRANSGRPAGTPSTGGTGSVIGSISPHRSIHEPARSESESRAGSGGRVSYCQHLPRHCLEGRVMFPT